MSGSPVTGAAPREEFGGRRAALVVAVTDYVDPSLRRLRAPAGDAADLRDVLADPEVGGFSVTSVINEKAQQIRLAIEDFLADRSPDDLLLVYLSCHGMIDLRRRLYFAARDTIKNRLASSGVEASWVLDQLEDCRARKQVVILDCCFSGAFAQGSKGDTDLGIGERLVGEGRGRVVLTASRGTEYSFEGEPLHGEDAARGSVFTGALVDGIRTGAADNDHDGLISVDDAYTYAFERVRRAGTSQTPQRWLYGAEGEILLARTPPASKPDPVPRQEELAPEQPPTAQPPREQEPPTGADAIGMQPPQRKVALRKVAYAVAAALLLGSAVVVGVLLASDPSAPPSNDSGGSTGGSSDTSGTLRAKAPWRLVIRDHIEGNDVGCDVTLTNADSEEQHEWQDLYGSFRSYQMPDSGTFSYKVSDPGCLLLARPGAGSVKLPFAFESGVGDTDAFRTAGPLEVEVLDFSGNSSCDPELHALQDGRVLDFDSIAKGARPTTLDPQGETSVYLSAPDCGVRVSPAQ